MQEGFKSEDIEKLKNQIIDRALLVGVILGAVTFSLTTLSFNANPHKIGYIIDFIILLTLSLLYFKREQISLKVKTFGIIISLFLLIFTDIYRYGVFSNDKILFILIPLFSYFSMTIRQTIIISIVCVVTYIWFSISFVNGSMIPIYDYFAKNKSYNIWAINILLITILSSIIIVLFERFKRALVHLIQQLQAKNKELENYGDKLEHMVEEKTLNLEKVNEKLVQTNNELQEKNKIIESQNSELIFTLNYLRDTQSQLVLAEKMASLGVLTAGVAHEINNPLNFIIGAKNGLEDYFNTEAPEHKEKLSTILECLETGVNRASDVVQRLHQLRINNEIANEICDINEIITECISSLGLESFNNITFSKQFCNEVLLIKGNTEKLSQVFKIILENSLQSISDEGYIIIETCRINKVASITITDSGVGISRDNIARVTDPFFTTKDPGKGIGLGLSIAYNIIKDHKGTITINSVEGEGTTVKIEIPLH